MLTFIGIGRGDRLADLGAGAGYSIAALAEAVGPSGVVYARHDARTPSDLPDSAERDTEDVLPSNLKLMRTPLHAPFSAEAVRLDEVTFFFGYHELVAEERDRREFNRAVLRALKPGGLYVIAEHAAPEGSGLRAAKELQRIEARVVRADVEAAGFAFVEAADFLSSGASAQTERGATPETSSQYLLKFRKPR
jgi:predicted methyltransferase